MPQELRTGTAYMVVGLGASMAASFGAQIIASRALGPETYGLYGLVISNVALVSGFLSPGLSGAMATLVAEQDALENKPGVSQVVKNGLAIEVLLTMLLSGFLLWQTEKIATSFFEGFQGLVLVFIFLVALEGFYGLLAGVIQGFRELKCLAFIRVLQRIALLSLLSLLAAGMAAGLVGVLTAQVLSVCCALFLTILFARKFIKKSAGDAQDSSRHVESGYYQDILTFAVPVSLAAVAASLIQNSGPAIMSYFSADQAGLQLGILTLLFRLGKMLDRLLKTVIRSAFPYFVRWRSLGDTRRLQRYIRRMNLLLGGGYLFMIGIVYLVGSFLISLAFGRAYILAASYLPLALLAFWTVSIQDIYRIALFSLKATTQFFVVNLVGTIIYFLVIIVMKSRGDAIDLITLIFSSIIISNIIIIIGALFLLKVVLKDAAPSSPTERFIE